MSEKTAAQLVAERNRKATKMRYLMDNPGGRSPGELTDLRNEIGMIEDELATAYAVPAATFPTEAWAQMAAGDWSRRESVRYID